MSEPPESLAGVSDIDYTDTRALVTGSTSGIGRETALALGRLGATVFVHGRDADAGRTVVDELAASGADGRFIEADYADTAAVRDLAETVRAETSGLDVLINNAGGLVRDGRLTNRGIEYTFQVNHLGPYLLTAELVDHLEPGARVVTTASAAHQAATLNVERVTRPDGGLSAYSHAKLANVLFARELARRLQRTGRSVTSNSVHPGAIPGSGFTRFLPGPISALAGVLEGVPGITSVADGAAALLFAACAPRLDDVSGRYFTGQRPATPADAATDDEAARKLWERSAELVDIEEPLADT
mgnify:FL=1